MMRYLSICLVSTASLFLTSCTTVEFAYNNAPGYLAGEFDDAFDSNDAQSEQVDLALAQFFAWHRQYELDSYRQFLDAAAASIADGIEADEFLQISEELWQAWHRSLARLSEDFAPVLGTLSPQQIDHYEEYFRDKSEKYEDFLAMDEGERREYRIDKRLETLEEWFGDLSDRQREAFSTGLSQLPEYYPHWITYREARHRALVSALRNAPEDGLSPQQLLDIAISPDSDYARNFQPVRTAYWQAYAHMIEDLSDSLTSMQLQHAVNRLGNYAEGIGNLAQAE